MGDERGCKWLGIYVQERTQAEYTGSDFHDTINPSIQDESLKQGGRIYTEASAQTKERTQGTKFTAKPTFGKD